MWPLSVWRWPPQALHGQHDGQHIFARLQRLDGLLKSLGLNLAAPWLPWAAAVACLLSGAMLMRLFRQRPCLRQRIHAGSESAKHHPRPLLLDLQAEDAFICDSCAAGERDATEKDSPAKKSRVTPANCLTCQKGDFMGTERNGSVAEDRRRGTAKAKVVQPHPRPDERDGQLRRAWTSARFFHRNLLEPISTKTEEEVKALEARREALARRLRKAAKVYVFHQRLAERRQLRRRPGEDSWAACGEESPRSSSLVQSRREFEELEARLVDIERRIAQERSKMSAPSSCLPSCLG